MQLAFHHNDDGLELWAGADRYYVGERFCFLRFVNRFARFLEQARRAPGPAFLATPVLVRERELDQAVELAFAAREAVAGFLVRDLGLARRLRGAARLVYAGEVMNRDGARSLAEHAGIEAVRLLAPTLPAIAAVSQELPVEAAIHGIVPLAASPRCLVRAHRGCGDCETRRRIAGDTAELLLKGNVVFAARPIQAFGLIQELEQAGLSIGVIEGLDMEQEEFVELAGVYRRQAPPPNRSSSGVFFGAPFAGRGGFAGLRLVEGPALAKRTD